MKELHTIYKYAKRQYETSCSFPSADQYRSAKVPRGMPLRNQNNCQSGRTPQN